MPPLGTELELVDDSQASVRSPLDLTSARRPQEPPELTVPSSPQPLPARHTVPEGGGGGESDVEQPQVPVEGTPLEDTSDE